MMEMEKTQNQFVDIKRCVLKTKKKLLHLECTWFLSCVDPCSVCVCVRERMSML